MRKMIMILAATAVLTIGSVTAVYAADTNNPILRSNYGCGNHGMYQDSGAYNSMIDIMRDNGFETAAKAMENRDYTAMNDFMNNLTEEQYEKMLEIMRSNGYAGMYGMMQSIGREGMIDMHNSMMGRYNRQ